MKSSRLPYRLRIPLLLSLACIPPAVSGQAEEAGRYPVFNFTPRDYNSLEQNWCAVQDHRGMMYFGNNHGILEYDGENWTLIPPQTSSPVKSLAVDTDGRVYFGSVGEFGYLASDSLGRLDYFLLSDLLDERYRDFNAIWKTHASKYGMVFQSNNYLYIWKNDSLKVVPSTEQLHESFYVEGTLFVKYLDSGLAYFNGEQIVPVPGGSLLKDFSIYSMLMLGDGRILVVTEKGGFYSLSLQGGDPDRAKISKIHTPYDGLFTRVVIFNAVRINPDRIALGTWGYGSIIIDSLFNVVAIIDKNAGLQDQIVQAQYCDASGKLWLALSSGISRVDVRAPLTKFGDNEGLTGTIQALTRFNGRIFASTNVGLFYMDHICPDPDLSSFTEAIFKPVEDITDECWDMITYRNGTEEILLFATNTDVTELKKGFRKATVITDYVYKLYQSGLDPNRVYVGLESGLMSIYRKNGHWIEEDRIAGVNEKITSLSEDHVGNLWMGTDEEGVLKLHIRNFSGDRIGEYTISRYGEESGLPEGPFVISQFRGPPTIATNRGLYKFNIMNESFSPDSSYGDRFADGSLYIHRISEHPQPEIWMVTYSEAAKEFKYEAGYLEKQGSNAYAWISEPFRRLSEELIHAIYREKDGIVWLGGSQGLFRFDMNNPLNYREDYHAYIRRVELGGGRLLFGGAFGDERGIQSMIQMAGLKPDLPYQDNSLIFNYSAEPGEDETFTRYSYFLEGNDRSWSEWVPEPKKEYTNLREGKYVFRVRARNIYWQVSREATYEFSILAPWYRKWWAYLIYILLASLVVYTIVKVYTRQLRQIIRERTAEVVAQKEVIEEKNKDIMDSIQYAKKIQQALLPPEDDLGKLDVDGFILFLPRDVVSGDFYWLAKQDSKVITVAADCTGHGVPGAFMSMLGVAFLNNIVEVKGIIKASDILNELRADVIAALKQKGQEGEQKDGMDIAVHVIDYKNMTIEFAGANNPLILIRDNKITHVKPDRMPIGIHERADESFRNNEMEAVRGDVLYTFSDGYQDQFGGPDNKKFMARKLKELLLSIHRKPMNEQKKILEKTFFDWISSSNVNQVDDVIVVGVRI